MCVDIACGYSNQTLTKIIAYFGISVYACLIAATALFGLILESKADLLRRNALISAADFNETYDLEEESPLSSIASGSQDDLTEWLQVLYPLRILFIIWLVIYFVAGLLLSFVLLEGAQKRNLGKVKMWFFGSVISYLLWIPIYAYWVWHAEEPINALMTGFMGYMVGGLSLWVVSAFIEELRIECISHRIGYKDVPFYKI
ncbi:unnamed protein product [Orchesella dallaii]|uniref:Uncharacterized protein n=1 Tax=Orchesella dallaii TaxID=48710 RepID=A0ABP1Q5C3_9HEXA